MKDFIARLPITNAKAHISGYHVLLGENTRQQLNETRVGYSEFGQVTQSMFFKTLASLSDHTTTYLDYFNELPNLLYSSTMNRDPDDSIVVMFSRDTTVDAEVCQKLKAAGLKLAFDSALITEDASLAELADIITVDFTNVTLSVQKELIHKYKNKVMFHAVKVVTWSDFKAAREMGYVLFQGYFFLWPVGTPQKEIKSLDLCLISIIAELDKPEPDFKHISDLVEHDLGLSYKLLRLVNSAYMAPKYRIKSISHALTYLGTRELHQWISMLLFSDIRTEDNAELVKMSLIRSKMMALVAQALQLPHSGSEPFFTGLFSLIDVILDKDIDELLIGLPITDDVKSALRGERNSLHDLLSFIISYEQAEWQRLNGNYPLSQITPQTMSSIYIEAHNWANLVDA